MRHIEEDHQKALIAWAKHYKLSEKKHPVHPGSSLSDYLSGSANGGKRNPREAARLKQTGVMAGFPDLQLFLPGGNVATTYLGLFIEMKRPKTRASSAGRVSPTQKKVLARLNYAGYKAVVCYGVDEAKQVITDYLNWELQR